MKVAFTVDVEPDCPPYLSGFRGVDEGMPLLLDLLDELRIPTTFFTTGEVAQRSPALIERMVRSSHELACHGMTHRAFPELTEQEAAWEIGESARILREFAEVTSFRAPYLRFPEAWLPMLEACGFSLDSSQGKHKPAQWPALARGSRTTVKRVPASTTSSVLRMPRRLRELLLRPLADPVVLFIHPWELVDLTREPIRWDCRAGTGPVVGSCLREVMQFYGARGAEFVRMRELLA